MVVIEEEAAGDPVPLPRLRPVLPEKSTSDSRLTSHLRSLNRTLTSRTDAHYKTNGWHLRGHFQAVIKQDIVSRVSEKAGLTKVRSEEAVDTVLEVLKRALKHGERIELRGFGVFLVKPRKSGIGRNPRTGGVVPIPPGKTVRFKPGKEIRPG